MRNECSNRRYSARQYMVIFLYNGKAISQGTEYQICWRVWWSTLCPGPTLEVDVSLMRYEQLSLRSSIWMDNKLVKLHNYEDLLTY